MAYQNPFASTASAPPSGSGGYQNPFAKTAPSAPTQSTVPQTAPRVSGSTNGIPNQALQGNLGGGYGTSNILDNSGVKSANDAPLGKPLMTFENQATRSSQLLADRVAPNFNPSVAQKMTSDMLQNGRIPDSITTPIRQKLGGTSSDELDHQIALELSGSNDRSNLKIEPGRTNGGLSAQHDQLENTLAKRVVNGEISLIAAQRLLAQAKGYDLPEFGGAQPQQGKFPASTPSMSAGDKAAMFFPSTMQSLADLQIDPANLKADPKKVLSDAWNTIKDTVVANKDNIAELFKPINPQDSASKAIGKKLNAVAGAANVAFSPISALFSAANDIPILGTVSKLISLPFEVMGDAGKVDAEAIVNKLPISPEAKQNIVGGLGAMISLAGQIALGGATEGITKEISAKFSPEDVKTITTMAEEKAQEMKANPQITEAQKPSLEELANEKSVASKQANSEVANGKPQESVTPTPEIMQPKELVVSGQARLEPKPLESEIVKPKETTKMRTGALRPIEGTGKIKVRGLSEGVESKLIANTPSKLPSFAPEEAVKLEQAQVASRLTDMMGDLPQYKQMDVADQGAKAIQLFEKDPEGAKQIAYGAKTPPKGLTPEAVFVAVEQDAIERGDVQTLKELANSRLTQEATTMGQRIRMLAERNPESPTDAIRAVQEARVKAVQEKLGKPVEEAKTEVVKEIKQRIASARPKRIAWADFIQEITC